MPHSLPRNASTAQAWPIRVLKAHSLAHMNLTPAEKAKLAVGWMSNKLVLTPTIELAAIAFNVSQQMITQQRKTQEPASLPAGMLAFGLLTATPDDLAAVFAEYESQVWAGLERAADTQR